MMEEQSPPNLSPCADWRDSKRYEALLKFDRPGWAGEFLKRNVDFITARRSLSDCPQTVPAGEKVRAIPPKVRFAASDDIRRFEPFGALFRRRLRLFDFLVSRLQSLRSVGAGGADRGRSPGRFRRLAF